VCTKREKENKEKDELKTTKVLIFVSSGQNFSQIITQFRQIERTEKVKQQQQQQQQP
jgi:hypothetical protein